MRTALDHGNGPAVMPMPQKPFPAPSEGAELLLQNLLRSSLIRSIDWNRLPTSERDELARYTDTNGLLNRLVKGKLLTEYQADRVRAGKTYGLILGNYRVLDRLGAGGMGIVFKAEHLRLPRVVAVKVLPLSTDKDDPLLLQRFLAEMWAAAQLQHPNIVSAIDSGEVAPTDSDSPILHYFVMEYVLGKDLEHHVQTNGPLAPIQACDVIHQVACALKEAENHSLVHRDIKPSNVILTEDGQAKLLDFGLARHLGNRLTQPGMVLGTLDYVAPEQVRDASLVDIRADIYGLGGTLFWCLTGRTPFVSTGNALQDLTCRLTQTPPSVRALRPEIPAGLDAVVFRMLAPDPDDRYANPEALMRALLPFLEPESCDANLLYTSETASDHRHSLAGPASTNIRMHQVLIVDDESDSRSLCRLSLQAEEISCDEAANGALALEALHAKRYDLVVSDIDMPEMNGPELLRRLRQSPPSAHLKVIMFSGRASADEMAQMLAAGADDYLTKPLSPVQLTSRVKAALRLKDAHERSDSLNRNLLTLNHELEQNLTARDSDLIHARNALVLALAELVAHRDTETGAHLMRLQRYSRCLAEEAAAFPKFTAQIDEHFIQMLECCAPLHDIGKVGLPDNILLKPGKLDADERVLMQTHTVMGAETLRKVAERHGFAVTFFQMAIDIARHHHEHYDGKGYPDRLAGEDIPLSARIVAIGDVYDALRSRRPYKPALAHTTAMQLITEGSPGHFEPLLLEAFQRCAVRIEGIAREVAD